MIFLEDYIYTFW